MKKVLVRQEKVTIPTYPISAYDKNPMFLEKRVYQGSSGRVYPHPVCEGVSDTKIDREYDAIYLENDYLLVMILPELGGRIQRMYDKTNGYDAVYYNEVIKPALVGLAGPWISGGIEFNWPQHHRPSTYDPTDWKIESGADGSGSVRPKRCSTPRAWPDLRSTLTARIWKSTGRCIILRTVRRPFCGGRTLLCRSTMPRSRFSRPMYTL